MVRRYNYCEGDEDMCEDIHGAYVSYHDYAALESENARLREALRECVHQISCVRDYYTILPNDDPKLVYALRKAREVLDNKKGESK